MATVVAGASAGFFMDKVTQTPNFLSIVEAEAV